MFKSFIEAQLPVSRVSKECYKERSAKDGQTLTGLGKWWGRKPLLLVRAAIIGLLMPASNDPKKDREVFLKILTMDEAGLQQRRTKNVAAADEEKKGVVTRRGAWSLLSDADRKRWLTGDSTQFKAKFERQDAESKAKLQSQLFSRLSYDEKIELCARPEEIDGPPDVAWAEINAHLGTAAKNLPELVRQLGERQFGHTPRVGDAFCGGGSIPFEAARIGCEAFGSDLNPIAAMLTWAALNIVGGGPEVAEKVRAVQKTVYNAVDKQITKWGIEHNEKGHRADAYLYCAEARCPECGWMIPLASSWVVSERFNGIVELVPDAKRKRFDFSVRTNVSTSDLDAADKAGTVHDKALHCPNPKCVDSDGQPKRTPISTLRGDTRDTYGLRLWENSDVTSRPEDVFQERLYCIRYTGADGERFFVSPDKHDLKREEKVLELLRERFTEWQERGFIPSRTIEPGDETTRLQRERGWTHWHHLFTPRQLLTLGLLNSAIAETGQPLPVEVALRQGLSRSADYNARLSRWHTRKVGDKSEQVFSNQALNTLFDYAARTVLSLEPAFFLNVRSEKIDSPSEVQTVDARVLTQHSDYWLTDPPYADAINYHELSEFFLAWHEKQLPRLFPNWYADSKRALAVRGSTDAFRKSMVECYRNLAHNMPENGAQVVMFTHQDATVWADLALILWASGLRVTAAWCIITETDTSMREGNYVQGTVLLILRKRTGDQEAFLADIVPMVEDEVRRQLDSMLALESAEDPNFSDTDFQLAAYAAALRVLTQYRSIGEVDVERELSRQRDPNEKSPIVAIIEDAVHTACNYLVPQGFDGAHWKRLGEEERFYLKGLDLECKGENRTGAYQELSRGFGLKEYKPLLQSGKANTARLKTASEFSNKELDTSGFGSSLVRKALFAVRETVRDDNAKAGKTYLRTELPDYWGRRPLLAGVLRYLSTMGMKLEHWKKDAAAAQTLAGAVENDHA